MTTVLGILVVLLVIGALGYFLPSFLNGSFPTRASTSNTSGVGSTSSMSFESSRSNSSTSSTATSTAAVTTQGWPPRDPSISNGTAKVGYPLDYGRLANYSLSLINHDRAQFGRNPVTVSANAVGQQHADSMLYFGYTSHWDTEGYKPYMRYTLLDGGGAVAENVAMESWTGPHFLTSAILEEGLNGSEFSMMYNDSSCCNNGHRLNILESLHNRVSIGIAYNATHLYFVEDFENYYVNLSLPINGPNFQIKVIGKPLQTISSSRVLVFFDSLPTPLSRTQLTNGPHSYSQGNFTGGVFPPCLLTCPFYPDKVNEYATVWQVTPTRVDVEFSLSSFVTKYGKGVYTLYLVLDDNSTQLITSLSIFDNG